MFVVKGARASAFEQGHETEPRGEERLLGHEQPREEATGTQIESLQRLGILSQRSVKKKTNARVGIWNHLRGADSQPNKTLGRAWGNHG